MKKINSNKYLNNLKKSWKEVIEENIEVELIEN